jgi:hypothetical protein
LADAEEKLNNCRSNSVEEKNALLLECEEALKYSEMERIKIKKDWMGKWQKELSARMKCDTFKGVLEAKVAEEKKLLEFTINQIKVKQTEFFSK